MELEEGCYVESGNFLVQDENGHFQEKPRFGEYVLPLAERERQWKKVVLQSANNRLCRIYLKRSL